MQGGYGVSFTIDKYGSIGQISPDGTIDGGDSVNWEGHRSYLSNDRLYGTMGILTYQEFFSEFGYVRHPESAPTASYYKNPWNGNISRDQLTGILCYHIKYTNDLEALKIILHHGAWLWLFAYNTVRNGDTTFKWKWPDVTLFDIWALELRMFGKLSWIFWPILNILDIHNLLNTISFNWIEPEDEDSISFAIKTIACREHIPTITSWITWKILKKDKLLRLVKSYWCNWRRNCGMYDLYEKKVKELD